MGEIEVIKDAKEVVIHSDIFLYGDSADEHYQKMFVDEIQELWNEPEGTIRLDKEYFRVIFKIGGRLRPDLTQLEVLENTNPRNNYFRVEDFSPIHISWVDGIGSNTGYMWKDNLYEGSTTPTHEYGHTIGLKHPDYLNIIGEGQPSIMYPRGTLCDPEYQWIPTAQPGMHGGTLNSIYRRVLQSDIDLLNLPNLIERKQPFIGAFTSIYHPRHFKPVEA